VLSSSSIVEKMTVLTLELLPFWLSTVARFVLAHATAYQLVTSLRVVVW